jgi:hypothetical protein
VATLCAPFVEELPVTGASIAVFGMNGQQSTICASDPLAARAEALQFELGEGPHWQALGTGRPVLCPDLAHGDDSHWPVFGSAARQLGIGALFAFPMIMGAASVGVVDLYRLSPGAMNERMVAKAASMAGRTAVDAVRRGLQSANDESLEEPETAPSLRREVHQATGIVIAQLETTATDAFSRLRAYAFSSGRPVEDVARDVVAGRLDFRNLP